MTPLAPLEEFRLSERDLDENASFEWLLQPLGIDSRQRTPVIGVLGLARSGLGAARLGVSRGLGVLMLDRNEPQAEAAVGELLAAGAELRVGEHDPKWLGEVDLLVKSPGVPPTIPFLESARTAGVPIIGELELASLAATGPIVAITGTNGKSTTTAWIGDMLGREGGSVAVVGNIGRPVSDGVLENPESTFVAEVSSFQLEDTRTFRPRVATLLNLSPDHLDRHVSFEAYRAAKLSMFSRQAGDDIAVLGDGLDELATDPALRPILSRIRTLRVRTEDRGEDGAFLSDDSLWVRDEGVEVRLQQRERLSLPGPHNLANALAAVATAWAAGAREESISDSLASFGGLPHRLESVGVIGGIACINDSKATNVDSLAVALASFDGSVRLIAGGVGKGQDFSPLGPLVATRTVAAYLIGEAAEEMARAWPGARIESCDSLEQALDQALADASGEPGGVILLSPGCASFDMFSNYEVRGDTFRALVAERSQP